jgi:hypothetical protein
VSPIVKYSPYMINISLRARDKELLSSLRPLFLRWPPKCNELVWNFIFLVHISRSCGERQLQRMIHPYQPWTWRSSYPVNPNPHKLPTLRSRVLRYSGDF